MRYLISLTCSILATFTGLGISTSSGMDSMAEFFQLREKQGKQRAAMGVVIHEQYVKSSFKPTVEEAIDQSRFFARRWHIQGRHTSLSILRPFWNSNPVAHHYLRWNQDDLDLISTDDGKTLRTVLLPKEIALIHKSNAGKAIHSERSGALLLGTASDGIAVVDKDLLKIYDSGAVAKIGSAIYGCSFDGDLLWTWLNRTPNPLFTYTIQSKSGKPILLIKDPNARCLVGMTQEGKELFRVTSGELQTHIITEDPDGEPMILVTSDSSTTCYDLNLD